MSPLFSKLVVGEPPGAASPDGPVHILLVDARDDKLLALQAILADLGEHLVLAQSGPEVLRCLPKQGFALMPEDFDVRTTRTLGLKLVSDLARQLGGTVKLEGDNGTAVRITLTEPCTTNRVG